jgi:spore coat polysaccharide biosynthesis predicted glycosyltransferase SpsG
MKIAVITEGGQGIGLGHLTRCLSLTSEFTKSGAEVTFFVNQDDAVMQILEGSSPYFARENHEGLCGTLDQAGASFDVCLVDSYLLSLPYYKKIAERCKLLVCFDDYNRCQYPQGIVINAVWRSKGMGYQDNAQVYLLGHDYITLREGFLGHSRDYTQEKIERVLIILGGQDLRGLTPRVYKCLRGRYPRVELSIVLGADKAQHDILSKSQDAYTKWHFRLNELEMAREMISADLAISACGQTIFELAYTGTPTVGIGIADNQKDNIDVWQKIGFLEFAGWFDDEFLEEKIISKIQGLEDHKRREQLAFVGRKAVDGHGAERIAQEVYKRLKNA